MASDVGDLASHSVICVGYSEPKHYHWHLGLCIPVKGHCCYSVISYKLICVWTLFVCLCVISFFFPGVRNRATGAALLTDVISQKDLFIQTFTFPISFISNEIKMMKLVLTWFQAAHFYLYHDGQRHWWFGQACKNTQVLHVDTKLLHLCVYLCADRMWHKLI